MMFRFRRLLCISGCLLALASCSKNSKDTLPEPAAASLSAQAQAFVPVTETFTRPGSPFSFKLINNSPDFTLVTKTALVDLFFDVYPIMVAYLNPNAQKEVTVIIQPGHEYPGSASNGIITIDAAFINANPINIDVLTHEVTHIIQEYKVGPHFMAEGIPDFVRYMINTRSAAPGPIFGALEPRPLSTGYNVASRFLVWIEKRVLPGAVLDADKACRAGTYTPKFWWTRTGRSIEQLWTIYTANSNYEGPAITLPPYVPVPGGILSDGAFKIINTMSLLTPDISRASTNDNADFMQWHYEGNMNQLWQLIHQGGNWYRISTGHSAKVLGAVGNNIQQMEWTGNDQQQWKPVQNPDGSWLFINKQTGLIWDVANANNTAGSRIILGHQHGGSSQKWTLTAL
ncbi:RICIN domain-containing protein [Chitinophaga nivalis]|uniref:RICIN domain-containing protein n=1 Tax=Chitinophaga nivalis TaxID=2991709 RepID=A0ABT3IMG7_9BACT|nr:RICIN domain-containing protein [Chitinophaga nivalis]MCW3465164.1 RICIN domain-containing protein [Chitinophaga nivalis]MCW3485144.1 RICIN domain-containing protein [Chitinophaga nivalis]